MISPSKAFGTPSRSRPAHRVLPRPDAPEIRLRPRLGLRPALALLLLSLAPIGAPAQGPAPSAGDPDASGRPGPADGQPSADPDQNAQGRPSPPSPPPPPPTGVDPQAYQDLADLAVAGDPDAQFRLGLVWLEADEDARRPRQALRWFRLAARQRHAPSLFALGIMHEIGDGIEPDMAKAASFYLRAADLGHSGAQDNYARCLTFGIGVETDLDAAFLWYRRAAWQGNPSAQLGLGLAYLSGSGTKKDLAAAFQWIEKSAEQDHTPALAELGVIYLAGEEVPRDLEAAITWLERAAANGDPWSANNLAWLYATSEEAEFLDAEKAVANGEVAIDLAEAAYGEVPAEIADTIAATHARASDWEQAIQWQQIAISSLAERLEAAGEDNPDQEQDRANLEDFKKRLQLYRDKTPYVERSADQQEPSPRFRDI